MAYLDVFCDCVEHKPSSRKPVDDGRCGGLGVCIIVGMMMGAVAGTVVRYFETPQNSSSALYSSHWPAAAFAPYVGAIIESAGPAIAA